MYDLTLQAILTRALAVALIAAVQGFCVAFTAVRLGDPGPGYDGRVRLSPAAHIDPLGAAAMVLFGLGWSKPVEIDVALLRPGRFAVVVPVLVAALGLLLFGLAQWRLAAPALTLLPVSESLAVLALLRMLGQLCLANALFNLIPLPPLTGGLLWQALGVKLPPLVRQGLPFVLFVLVATGLAGQVIRPVHESLAASLFSLQIGVTAP